MPLETLGRALRGELKPVYLFLSGESVWREKAELEVSRLALSGPAAAFNHSVFRAEEDPEAEALSVARTLPMMAARRLVVVRDVQGASPSFLEALLSYCADPSPSTVLLLLGSAWPRPVGGVDFGRRSEGAIKRAEGVVIRAKAQRGDPARFAVKYAEEIGCRLSMRNAERLVAQVGENLGSLRNELDKVAQWLGGSGEIDDVALKAVCSLLAEADDWALVRHLLEGNAGGALGTTFRLLEEGEAELKLMGMINWQFRQLLSLQDSMRTGCSPREAGVKMRGPSLDRARRLLQRSPLPAAEILERLAEANRQMNSSRAGSRRILEGLVLSLTQTVRP